MIQLDCHCVGTLLYESDKHLSNPIVLNFTWSSTGTITIIDTATDTLVAMVGCDPGCHGVNFGAKAPSVANPNGGYYAYVTSKFSNRLIVLDYDPNGDGNVADAVVAGWVVLDDSAAPAANAKAGWETGPWKLRVRLLCSEILLCTQNG